MSMQTADAAPVPWAVPVDDVIDGVRSDRDDGLAAAEAAQRLERDGPNELVERTPPSIWHRFAAQFTDPLVVLLLGAIVVSTLAWWSDGADGAPVESIVIAVIVLANAVIGVWQEGKAVDAVAALRRLVRLQVTVLRDGAALVVPSTDLVVGDVVALAEGDAVAADARLVETHGLEISEAALTGESLPVEKHTDVVVHDIPVADRRNMVHSGTAVTKGRGTCVVTATGAQTEVGRIAALLGEATEERTPLQRQIHELSRWLGIAVGVLAVVVIAAIWVSSDISSTADALDALLVAVSLAVAAVPEGLPAILTVVLALGVQRMAAHQAIVKRLLSVETLGAATVVCSDKTGTLTRNEMTAVRLWVAAGDAEVTGVGYEPVGSIVVRSDPTVARGAMVPAIDASRIDEVVVEEDLWALLSGGVAASDATLVRSGGTWVASGDPTEIALVVAAHKHRRSDRLARIRPRVEEVTFDSERRLMSTLHPTDDDGSWDQYTKGAPDVVLDRCVSALHRGVETDLSDRDRAIVEQVIESFADDGLRTLAVAHRRHTGRPDSFDEGFETHLTLLGIVGIADPAKAEVRPVIAEAARAGVRTVMVTGDHPRTARSIGRTLGLPVDGERSVVSGSDLSNGVVLDEVVDDAAVFARVAPEDKLDIVRSLQSHGHVVAMTGDGVNDAPALRHADIGVAMGGAGTEVARDAADMVLADDDFRTIVRAIREGREIFANIRKFLRYLLGSNSGEVLVMVIGVLAASLIGLTAGADGELAVPLLATQILWINLLTDSTLALALGVDPSVDDVMANPPRGEDEPIIDGPMWTTIGLVGVTTALAGLVALDLELAGGMLGGDGDITTARTMLFTTLVLAQIFNAFNARSDRVSAFVDPFGNRLLWAAAALTVVLQVAVVHTAPLQRAFDTTSLDAAQWAICAGLSSSVLIVNEIRKWGVAQRRRGAARRRGVADHTGAERREQVGPPATASSRT